LTTKRIDLDELWHLYSGGKQTYAQLAERFCCSSRTIQRMLDKATVFQRKEFSSVAVVIMDTTYFGRGFGVMVFKNGLDGVVLYKQYFDRLSNHMFAMKPMRYIWQGFQKSVEEVLIFRELFAMVDKDYLDFLVIFQYKCASFIRYK
jgi:hypothetical protein